MVIFLVSPNYTAGFADEKVELGMPFSRNFTLEANPDVGDNFTWTRNGMAYSEDVTATSIFIDSTTVADAGTYTVIAGNTIGSTMASFTLKITCKLLDKLYYGGFSLCLPNIP